MILALLAFALVAAQVPYHDPREQPRTYSGPGREEPEPKQVREVLIGFFGPADGMLWQGATLAIEEANREGGYRGAPFRLISGWAENPWAAGASRVVRMVYQDKVWAIIGGIDGATTHLAEQVVAKALVPLVNPAATDRSIHAASVPWMFSCVPGDQLLAPLVAGALPARFALLSGTDHDSRAFLTELKAALAGRRLAPQVQVDFESASLNPAGLAERALNLDAVVIAGAARDTARIVSALRERGYKGRLFGDPRAEGIEGIQAPALGNGDDAFRKRFVERWGRQPNYEAAHAYDAARLLAAAIRNAGLNRARILDAIRNLSPWQGVTGTIRWDAAGQNERVVRLTAP